ncbi:basic membrane family protein [Enterococcus faecalis]|nr:basic membrane family protein [Enterococcus faecalis]
MKQAKFLGLGLAAVALTIGLAACGGNSKKNANTKGDPQHSVVMVTDTAGIDDKSLTNLRGKECKSGAKSTNFQKDLKGMRIFNQMKHLIIHQTLTKPFQVNLKRFLALGIY